MKNKIEEFNEDPSKVEGHPFSDYDLANMLNDIVNKYDYAVEDYLAIKFMIDTQF